MQRVLRENLELGKLYYIEDLTEDDNKNLVPVIRVPKMAGIFKGLIPVNVELTDISWNAASFDWFEVSNMINMTDENDAHKYVIYHVQLNYLWNFYEVKKFKIQRDMENRAINLSLRNIIGDPYFTNSA
jgi:hypothetical protein